MSVFEVVNPADESVVTTVEELEADAVDAAVARAQVAQRRWAALELGDAQRGERRPLGGLDEYGVAGG